MKKVLFFLVTLWALIATYFLVVRNPLPFPDRGHRCFAVKGEDEAKIILKILGANGLKERFTFSPQGSTQTLMWDNETVIIQHEDPNAFASSALSLAVENPRVAAQKALEILKLNGFTGKISELENGKVVIVKNNIFVDCDLVFRLPIIKMGPIPNERRISE